MARNDKLGTVATTVTRANGVLVVRYHSTDIVTYDEKTTRVTLRTGGYDTVTTRRRMNQAAQQFGLGFQVVRVRGATMVRVYPRAELIPFTHNMSFKVGWTGEVEQ